MKLHKSKLQRDKEAAAAARSAFLLINARLYGAEVNCSAWTMQAILLLAEFSLDICRKKSMGSAEKALTRNMVKRAVDSAVRTEGKGLGEVRASMISSQMNELPSRGFLRSNL